MRNLSRHADALAQCWARVNGLANVHCVGSGQSWSQAEAVANAAHKCNGQEQPVGVMVAQRRDASILAHLEPVPEPPAFAMMLAGLG